MGESEARVTRIVLPDGTPVWARISGAGELERPGPSGPGTEPGGLPYSDTGFAEQVQARVESLHGVVTGVARSLAGPLRAVRPDEVSVEFGIELTAKAGKVVGLLADGETKGAIKVTLTWNGGGPPAGDPAPPAQSAAPPAQSAVPLAQSAAPPAQSAVPLAQSAAPPAPPVPPRPPAPSTWTAPGAPAHPDGTVPPGGGRS
ncbi:CU044_2847 family protein [Streptomyces sp. NPDC019539]|uniref:CU044_2847 family protein n=1 Tax=Streptomyces sp. NPDC019539 TaxID=3365063 RepID=UPI0037B04583